MSTSYVQEAATIAAMARQLRRMSSLDDRGMAVLILAIDGFRMGDIRAFADRAIESERQRRIAFAHRIAPA